MKRLAKEQVLLQSSKSVTMRRIIIHAYDVDVGVALIMLIEITKIQWSMRFRQRPSANGKEKVPMW